jgi:long-chain acyl-CoA synthetase
MAATLGELLPEAACRFGDRTAVIVEDKVFTFNQLDELSNRIANGLVASGVKAGDRVTLYGHNCWEWLVAYYGIVKTGAVINPINVMLTAEEVRYAVENSGARAVVASQDKGGPLLDIKGGTNLSNVVLWGDTAQRALPRSRIGCAMANQDLI